MNAPTPLKADVSEAALQASIAAVARIDVIPTMLEVICRTTGMGFAAVARVTDTRWIACQVKDDIAFGLRPGSELKVETTICDEIRDSRNPVVIDHVAEDPDFAAHHTPRMYGFQSYISMPIYYHGGEFFGTLCAIDPHPAKLKTTAITGMFRLFADLIGFHLDAIETLQAHEVALIDEREAANLREQFIAVLGHDLRNPLASVDAGAATLKRMPLGEKALSIVHRMERSVRRMAGLIDDTLDFARGRLGSGLSLTRSGGKPLTPVLEQVIAEVRAAWPDHTIQASLDLDRDIDCDDTRIAQLLSNLLANAITHGASGQPIQVSASIKDEQFELCVTNSGEPIPAELVGNLFQPFFRATARPSAQGLGLGLYIVSEIARAHGGRMEVISDSRKTCFTFRMPVR